MRTAIRVLFWLGFLAVAFVTLAPIDYRPVTMLPAQVERFATFLIISALLALGYPRHRMVWLLGLIAVAGLLEVLQNMVPGRHGRLHDFEAKAIGVVVGAAVGLLGEWIVFGRGSSSRHPAPPHPPT